MGAGGSKKVKQDLDAARARQAREQVSDVMDFGESFPDDRDAADVSSVPISSPSRVNKLEHKPLPSKNMEEHGSDSWQFSGDTDMRITELDDQAKKKSARGSPSSPKKGATRVEAKPSARSPVLPVGSKKPLSPQIDALMIVPNDQLVLEDVRTPPASKSRRKRINSAFADESKALDHEPEIEVEHKHGPPGSRGGSSGGGGRKLCSGKSSRSGSGSGGREKELPVLVRTSSQEYRQNEAIKAAAASTAQAIVSQSFQQPSDRKPAPVSVVSASFKPSSITARTPPNRERSNVKLPVDTNPDPDATLFTSASDRPPKSPVRENSASSQSGGNVRSVTPPRTPTHPTPAVHIQSPPGSSSGRRSIKSPLAASRLVVPPSPTYHPSKHEQRLHQLQLQNLSAMNDDPLLTTPSPMPRGASSRLKPSLSNTSIDFEDPDGDDDDAYPLSSSTEARISHENAALLDLQRQRTLSSMHNAKLEMEVESLMKQLAQLDEMEEQEESELHSMAKMASNVVGRSSEKKKQYQQHHGEEEHPHPHPHPPVSSHPSTEEQQTALPHHPYHSHPHHPHHHARHIQHHHHHHDDAQPKSQTKPLQQPQEKPQPQQQPYQSPKAKPLQHLSADRKAQALSISPVDRNGGESKPTRDRSEAHHSHNHKPRTRHSEAEESHHPHDDRRGSKEKTVESKADPAASDSDMARLKQEMRADTAVLEEQRRKRRSNAREQFLKEQQQHQQLQQKQKHIPVVGKEARMKEQESVVSPPPKSAGRNGKRKGNDPPPRSNSGPDVLSPDNQKENHGHAGLNAADDVRGTGSSSQAAGGDGGVLSMAQQRQSRVGRLAHLNKLKGASSSDNTLLNHDSSNGNKNLAKDIAEEKMSGARADQDMQFNQFAGSKASLEHHHNGKHRGARGRPPAEEKASPNNYFDIEESPRDVEDREDKVTPLKYHTPVKNNLSPHLEHKKEISDKVKDPRSKLAVSPIRRQRVTAQKEVDASLLKMNEALAGVGHAKVVADMDMISGAHKISSGSVAGGPTGGRVTGSGASNDTHRSHPDTVTEHAPKKSVKSRSVLKNLNKRHPSLNPTSSNTSLDTSFDESSMDSHELSLDEDHGKYVPTANNHSIPEDKPLNVPDEDFKGVAALKRKGRGKVGKKAHGLQPPAQRETARQIINKKDRWSETMDMRRMEVELLLRRPINSDADIDFTLASAEAGLLFMDELNRVAKSLHILRGTLSRWLLPFDHNTAISDQISNFHSVVDSMPDSIRGKLTEKEVHYLVSGLNSVRQLVRVKIADDNDLEQVSVHVHIFVSSRIWPCVLD